MNKDVREMKDTIERQNSKVFFLEGEMNTLGTKYKNLEVKHFQYSDVIKD